jgi:hypothetical protein
MKNKILVSIFIAILFVAFPNINCSKDGGGDGFFIPIISAVTWVNKDNADNYFNFFGETANVNTSTFEGNEHFGSPDTTFHFTGSFTNHNIQFMYDNNPDFGVRSGKTYSGTINDASNVITLHSNDLGDLVLQKQ